ncbi:alkyl/aryl-sulfatase [Streptomyces blastmyceticus]|uniref:Alkyl sulfatase dimerization domain-containing protein n=1 Tax=Streptomyces blastmyceticus TaxID=68180 RepID=A0ABN0WWM0_9ACTN
MSGLSEPIEPSASVADANRKTGTAVRQDNGDDFKDAQYGLIAVPEIPAIPSRKHPDKVVWNFEAYEFLDPGLREDFPTVNGSLLRQGQLTHIAGLFQVASSGNRAIYQVRGYDLSNMTIIEGDTGIIVIDPLACYETAKHALKLYRNHVSDTRPIVAVIYTHCHVDHFGGSRGLFHDKNDTLEPGIPVVAPAGFLEHAVSENIYAGPAMARRAQYMYAAQLPKAPTGQVGAGLGLTISTGEVSLIPPTDYIGSAEAVLSKDWSPADVIPWTPGLHRRTIDGVRFVFQLTPGTEAPAEMNIYLPELRALCAAENATHTLHNILSLRGAQVRDAHAWSKYLTEMIQTFGEHTEVEFASHHWPRWGRENILTFLSNQRDMYAYLNDQTLRLINDGYTGIEIAEKLQHLPAGIADHWYSQGYYGSLSHNFKAVYQRYMGWFDGNPAHLWNLPPSESGARYVAAMGGPQAVVDEARRVFALDTTEGFRWAVEILNHVIFAAGRGDGNPEVPEPVLEQAKQLQAQVMTQLGYGAENGTWRNFFLTGAEEVVGGPQPLITTQSSADLVRSTSLEQYFSMLARSIDGPKAADEQRSPIVLRWVISDTGQECTTTLRNGVLVYVEGADRFAGPPQVTIKLTRETLNSLAETPLFRRNFDTAVDAAPQQIELSPASGKAAADTVFGYLTIPDPKFPIVGPKLTS